ncbi:unnamed protein product [Anisakis simplex]|uniref:UPF0669 protein C6orf120 (inferred by orthology to a human protein) n=1 Tax=Anisakis simplex TaxID=6269 RepID=A0A0M3JQV2_ANISI|nr:unnamed protein product [Anisakis simplex]
MIRGELAATNWSYFDLKWEGRLRIILESVIGDADLYLSYTRKRPGIKVHEHDMLSMTCGLDVLDVPQSVKRPLHLGIYGHPSKSETSYKMLLVMVQKQDGEFEDDLNVSPELIELFGDDLQTDDYKFTFKETLFTILRFFFEVLIEILA